MLAAVAGRVLIQCCGVRQPLWPLQVQTGLAVPQLPAGFSDIRGRFRGRRQAQLPAADKTARRCVRIGHAAGFAA